MPVALRVQNAIIARLKQCSSKKHIHKNEFDNTTEQAVDNNVIQRYRLAEEG